MDVKDELRDLWCSQPDEVSAKKEELVELVQNKTMQFDRRIFRRNLRECLAAVAVTALFTWAAFHALNALQQTGLLIVAASGLCIIFFLLRYGRASAPVDPDQDMSVYRRALVERYDQQIELLKSVKYWYLLPPWIGLVLNTAGLMLSHAHVGSPLWPDFIAPAIYSAIFAFVWWLNEGPTVARLRAERARVLALVDDPAGSGGSIED